MAIQETNDIIGIGSVDAPRVSAKTGVGGEWLLIERIPAPEGDRDAPLQALIIDSWLLTELLGLCHWYVCVKARLKRR